MQKGWSWGLWGPGSVAPRGAEPQLCCLQPPASLIPELTGVGWGRGRARPPPVPPPASRAPFARPGPAPQHQPWPWPWARSSPCPSSSSARCRLTVGGLAPRPRTRSQRGPCRGRGARHKGSWCRMPSPPAPGEVPVLVLVGAGGRHRPLALCPLGLVWPRGRGTPREERHRGRMQDREQPRHRAHCRDGGTKGTLVGVLGWKWGRGSQSRLQGGLPITSVLVPACPRTAPCPPERPPRTVPPRGSRGSAALGARLGTGTGTGAALHRALQPPRRRATLGSWGPDRKETSPPRSVTGTRWGRAVFQDRRVVTGRNWSKAAGRKRAGRDALG